MRNDDISKALMVLTRSSVNADKPARRLRGREGTGYNSAFRSLKRTYVILVSYLFIISVSITWYAIDKACRCKR